MTLSSLQAQAPRVILSDFSPSNYTERSKRKPASIVVCSSGLRLRLERDCSQISPWSLKVMLEVLSRKVCVELMPSSSRFSAAFRSAIVRVQQTPKETKLCFTKLTSDFKINGLRGKVCNIVT
jgi:hypothetical protein